MQSLRLLLVFCCTTVCSYMCSGMEFDAAFNPFAHSMVHCKPSYENPVVVSVYNHLWSPLLVGFAHVTIKWYQTVLSESSKTWIPKLHQPGKNLKPQVLQRRLPPSCEERSSLRLLQSQESYLAGISSFQSSFWVVQHLAMKKCFTKK